MASSTSTDEPQGDGLLKEAFIIGMLGGPGSGKKTQCRLLSEKFDLVHIGIGDVLRQ